MKIFIIFILITTVLINLPSRLYFAIKGQYPRFVIKNRGSDIFSFILELAVVIWGMVTIGWL